MQAFSIRTNCRTASAKLSCRRGIALSGRVSRLAPRHAASTDVAGTATLVSSPPAQGLVEINQTNFYPTLEAAGDTLVVVDFFTDWCGPCKMIYPDLVKMSEEMSDVLIYKFNCNKTNKELGKQLGIRVAPTFHLYKRSEKVAEMTGAKVDKLRALIEEHK